MKLFKSPTSSKNTREIPFVDLRAQFHHICDEIEEKLADVITNTAFIKGKYVSEFEENFAKFCGAEHCMGVGNGTDALFIALKALDIGPGDEVIVPANTFVSTSEAVTLTGARVVFADCDPDTYNMDTSLIESKITSKTKAIIPVHLYGQPAQLPVICKIAKKHGLKIVQDCAQAHGASVEGNHLAGFGDVLCFSFYPGKNLGAYGDAGAIVTNDDELANQMRMFANHGRISKYDHEFEGMNSRMDGIQGAVLSVKLKYLPEWTEKRRKNAALYDQLLGGTNDIVTPKVASNVKHVYHLYVIRTKYRDKLQQYLGENSISTGIHYPIALPNLMAYRYLEHTPDDFPAATSCQNEILSLPMYPELDKEMIEYVTYKVKKFSGSVQH